MHRGVHGVDLVGLADRCEINTVDVLIILLCHHEDCVEIIIDIILELRIEALWHSAEPEIDEVIVQQLCEVFGEASERRERSHPSVVIRDLLLEPLLLGVHLIHAAAHAVEDLLHFLERDICRLHACGSVSHLVRKVFDPCEELLVWIRLLKWHQILDIGQLSHRIFEMDLVLSEIRLRDPVDVILRTGESDEFHFLNHNFLRLPASNIT